MIVRWLYGSMSLLKTERASVDIASILAVSVPRNLALNVTGALLFTGTRFAQYLEGLEIGVTRLKASICRDGRHASIVTIIEESIGARLFPDWSLAYAGSSRFVRHEVDRAIDSARHGRQRDARRLIKVMEAFAESSHPH